MKNYSNRENINEEKYNIFGQNVIARDFQYQKAKKKPTTEIL